MGRGCHTNFLTQIISIYDSAENAFKHPKNSHIVDQYKFWYKVQCAKYNSRPVLRLKQAKLGLLNQVVSPNEEEQSDDLVLWWRMIWYDNKWCDMISYDIILWRSSNHSLPRQGDRGEEEPVEGKGANFLLNLNLNPDPETWELNFTLTTSPDPNPTHLTIWLEPFKCIKPLLWFHLSN